MKVHHDYQSPNFAPNQIPVEFLVLHYTACDLERTMDIFMAPERKVCAHFVIDVDGRCFDLGEFFNGPILQGAHAGESKLAIDGVEHTAFNKMSIGIEIVNLNGNLFPYPDAQYEALRQLISHLQERFPALRDSRRIVGHEHIAHHRGKCDPGVAFDWPRLLASVGLKPQPFHSFFACKPADIARLRATIASRGADLDGDFWALTSAQLETSLREGR